MVTTMKRKLFAGLAVTALVSLPALAHHSFALYNMEETKTFTGVVTRVTTPVNVFVCSML